ncbi:peptide/nickel transport system substrate-binding protein [Desulfotomaculum arcticum]|uniref:Peptide/nickel transport system substrate-binding protein n=1 Tax=Desulfotruncus arcticus DSM 17038 TaxID=1121424 RepID=A0A1I2SYE1_9FIRM|nr:nickel ABC transporter substrate-binding protein [Desulfotruncus arcticus]SFG57628.1 peptide/nickel transport system substrate-binding protein [Desulfotomaculum arcticum] [Desulfotruncus arcticus DSM 17038]
MTNQLIKIFAQRPVFLLALLVLLMVFGAGCGGDRQEAEEKTAPDQELVVAVSGDVGVDRLDAASYEGLIQAYPMIYDGLVEYGEKGEILPALAESWDISGDGKVYTFHLRQGVKFSDGTDFNAEAAKFSMERWHGDPANSSLSVSNALKKAEAVDPYTLQLTFDKTYYPFLSELTYPRPVRMISPTAVEPQGDPGGKFIKAVGTGAWMVDSYTRDQQAVLVPNPNYWGKKPSLDRVVLKVVPDPQSRVLALQSGEVDLSGGGMGRIPLESISTIKEQDSLTMETTSSSTSYFLVFNYQNQFLQDLRVRKAINLALNRQTMVDNLLGGVGRPARGLFQFTVPYVTEANNKWYAYDPAQGRDLLQESGYRDQEGDGILEKNGRPLELNLVFQNQEYPEWKTMCEFVQGELKNSGIKVNLQMLESNAYYDALWKNRQYDMIIYRTYSDSWNPHGFLLGLFHQAGEAPAVAWADPGLEKLIDEVMPMMDEKERQAKYDQIFARMYQEAVCVPLYYPDEIFVMNKKVAGFAFGTNSYYPVRWEALQVK